MAVVVVVPVLDQAFIVGCKIKFKQKKSGFDQLTETTIIGGAVLIALGACEAALR